MHLCEVFGSLSEARMGYHGSSQDQPIFAPQHIGTNSTAFGPYGNTRSGIFFSNNRKFAALYGKVGHYQLNVRRTFNMETDRTNTIYQFFQSFDKDDPGEKSLAQEVYAVFSDSQYWQLFEDEVGERFVPFLRKLGYDSATYTETTDESGEEIKSRTIVVFDPKRVQRIP